MFSAAREVRFVFTRALRVLANSPKMQNGSLFFEEEVSNDQIRAFVKC